MDGWTDGRPWREQGRSRGSGDSSSRRAVMVAVVAVVAAVAAVAAATATRRRAEAARGRDITL
ncbi:hypothetical protein BS50DRAFT_339664 [Corynespora cassiicola Philippines]|uniref:Uncharacterized protein n=1 Tax=Corynespora cassiicola Philippines TaxID=1448308 RepID=A0A2T2NV71_CORCC|nr:hypothetical protein BS50DRAFT_339664 [Corynespora cassiicola Philippines]